MTADIKKFEFVDADKHSVECQMTADRVSMNRISDKAVRCNVCGAIMDIHQFPAFSGERWRPAHN